MSVQFGQWSFSGRGSDPDYLSRVREILLPYGPDGETSFSSDGVNFLYYDLRTTARTCSVPQPYVSPSGTVIVLDGRLDNRAEIRHQLDGPLPSDSADTLLISAAYEEWGTDCFARLVGDWAISIWNPKERMLLLAKDPVGTRLFYYRTTKDHVSWCTILDPLVLAEEKQFELNEEYIAGWLSFFPSAQLTPYRGIDAVPPSCFVRLGPGQQSIHKYWEFHTGREIRYREDAEYEEHFRMAFRQSLERRLCSEAPILAELSGGMDSSSIVCMSDDLISRGAAQTPRLDTVSYYNDSEPNWNERPYFAAVEQKRGRLGHHIDVGVHDSFQFNLQGSRFLATPASLSSTTRRAKQFSAYVASQGYRVLLSGIGGDEVLGGVPTPIPELKDLLVQFRLRSLAHALKIWSLEKRKPWLHLLFEACSGFFPPLLTIPSHARPPEWLDPSFVRRNRAALEGYVTRTAVLGPRPSFQDNLATLNALRRQVACFTLTPSVVYETRYPYLDRDLLDFLYAIPREQLVRPGQRRSLMRRALVGILPREVLERKRKAFVSRSPLKRVIEQGKCFFTIPDAPCTASFGIVDTVSLSHAMHRAQSGHDISVPSLLRTLIIHAWLQDVGRHGVWKARSDLKQFSPQQKGGEHHEIREAQSY